MSSQDLLSSLRQDTNSRIEKLESAPKTDVVNRIAELEAQMDKAAKIKDDSERNTRMQILQADFETLRKELKTEEEDLSQAILGLNALMNELGDEYLDLQQPSAEEKALVDAAEKKVAAAEAKLRSVEDAPGWKFIFSSREKALREAKSAIESAKQGVADAQAEAKSKARNRLLNASMEESLQEFMYRVERTIGIMENRAKEIQRQLDAVSLRKEDAFRVKEEAAKILTELDNQLNQLEGELHAAESQLETLVNGSPEYVAQEQSLSELRRKVEEVRGRRNEALVLFQSKERFATELDVHEKSQMKLRDNQRAWITLLKSDTEERLVTFKSRLEAMKAMSDQDVAQNLDELGTAIDRSNVDFMAKVGRASDDRRMNMIESQPERIAKIEQARAAQAEAQAAIREREAAALEAFRQRYGIDPMEGSFFSYVKQETEAESDSSK
jgi:peptidoglycan hydrolase CwlO-like protein